MVHASNFTLEVVLKSNPIESIQLRVIDPFGKMIFEHEIAPTNNRSEIQLEDHLFKNPGTYWLQIQQAEKKLIKKLIKI